MRVITVPAEFVAAAVMRAGEAGRRWVESLPDVVEALCAQWGLAVDGAPMHGFLGLVIPVRRGEEPCVLKVSSRDESTVDEAVALAAWQGRGAVRLLASEPECGGMLMERLDSRRSLLDVELVEALTVAGRVLRRLAIPAPAGPPRLRDVARELAGTFRARWERYGRPMPARWIDAACEAALTHGPSAGDLLVNYDLHYADVLAGTREPWLAVDPKVVAGDVEYGPAQLLWRRFEEIQAECGLERAFGILVESAELDAGLARAWTLVRCVDYWLWGLSIGLTEDPKRCHSIVDWLMGDDMGAAR